MLKSESEVITLAPELQNDVYGAFGRQCADEDLYYNREYEVAVAEGFEPWMQKPETPFEAINNAATQVDTTNIRVEVPPRNDSEGAQADAELVRKGLLGFWHTIYHHQGLVLHAAAKHQFLYGVAFLKLVYDRDVWGERPLIKKNEDYSTFKKRLGTWNDKNVNYFPFRLMLPKPAFVFPDPSSSGTKYWIEKTQKLAADVRRRWPEFEVAAKDTEWLDFYEYWDEKHSIYICDKRVLMEAKEHNYTLPPYVECPSGLGLDSTTAKPEERWRGLLYALKDRIRQEARLESMLEHIIASSAYPEDYIQGPAEMREELKQTANEWESHPAVLNVLAVDGAEFKTRNAHRIPPDAWQLLGQSSSRLRTATVEPVLTGSREQGVRAGYEVAMRAGLAKQKYGPALFSLERGCEGLGTRFLRMVEHCVADKVTVWAKTPAQSIDLAIGPKDIKGYYRHKVTLSSVSPEEEDRKAMLGQRLFTSGAISWWTLATRYLHIENPYDEMKQMLIEAAFKSPEVQAILATTLLAGGAVKEQAQNITGETTPFPNVGNRGNPPPSFPRPNEPERTRIMPRGPEEFEQNALQTTKPGGYQGKRSWPPQSGGPRA
uniref:Uncharacterized protein n=2 Tax=viral metagenome TaxID=1070528 RepID=A0A6H1ZWT2_9ZZZZ